MIAPDQTIRLGSPKNSPPGPRSSTIVLMVFGIDNRSGERLIVLNTVSAVAVGLCREDGTGRVRWPAGGWALLGRVRAF